MKCMCPTRSAWARWTTGFIDTLGILDKGRITIASMALGLGWGAYQAAIKYAKERRQFGKSLSEFQAIRRALLADSETELEAARLLIRRAAWLCDQEGKKITLQASMAKLYAAQAAMRACDRAVYRFTAAMATPASSPVEQKQCVMPSCARLAKAPTRSSDWSSVASCSGAASWWLAV